MKKHIILTIIASLFIFGCEAETTSNNGNDQLDNKLDSISVNKAISLDIEAFKDTDTGSKIRIETLNELAKTSATWNLPGRTYMRDIPSCIIYEINPSTYEQGMIIPRRIEIETDYGTVVGHTYVYIECECYYDENYIAHCKEQQPDINKPDFEWPEKYRPMDSDQLMVDIYNSEKYKEILEENNSEWQPYSVAVHNFYYF